jgi:hypothetical protein
MAGIDFPKMENRAPEIFISLHSTVKLAATDDKQRNVRHQFSLTRKNVVEEKILFQKNGI